MNGACDLPLPIDRDPVVTTTLITETELAVLIRESTREKVVSGAFGPEGLTLANTPTNQWAIDRVAELRRGA